MYEMSGSSSGTVDDELETSCRYAYTCRGWGETPSTSITLATSGSLGALGPAGAVLGKGRCERLSG